MLKFPAAAWGLHVLQDFVPWSSTPGLPDVAGNMSTDQRHALKEVRPMARPSNLLVAERDGAVAGYLSGAHQVPATTKT